jgi:hypothetical protein
MLRLAAVFHTTAQYESLHILILFPTSVKRQYLNPRPLSSFHLSLSYIHLLPPFLPSFCNIQNYDKNTRNIKRLM